MSKDTTFYIWAGVAVVVVSLLLAFGLTALIEWANADAVEACERLGGELLMRGFHCELPDGLIVDPVRWEESQ